MSDEVNEQLSEVSGQPERIPDGAVAAEQHFPPVTTDSGEEAEQPSRLLPYLVVGIGASAGGVEAYIELFENLPPDTGMAFIVASHLSADQKSHLADSLRRHTAMPTEDIEHGVRPEPDHVYVLPAGVQMRVERGRFALEQREAESPPRQIDWFFRSLAADQKNRAVGIILSGMDSDGALGLRAIKGEGGITIVQTPETARYPGMPRSSISADHVDMILPPGEIARHLAVLGGRFRSPELRSMEDGKAAGGGDQF